jgi:CheY-like chemotaxis protein
VRLANLHVLLVDDDLDSLALVREVLETAGAQVTAVAGAREGLEARGPVDFVITDIGMPEVDGYELLRHLRIRNAGRDLPAIALTAYARQEDAEKARQAGFQEHLTKPVDPAELLKAVASWGRCTRSP